MENLKTAKWVRVFEAAGEILLKVLGMCAVFIVFEYLLGLIPNLNADRELLVSMLLLPTLYILKDANIIIDPLTVVAESHPDKISVFRGVAPKVKDTLE